MSNLIIGIGIGVCCAALLTMWYFAKRAIAEAKAAEGTRDQGR